MKSGLYSCQDSDSTSTPVCLICRCLVACADQGLTDSDVSARELYGNALEQRLFVHLDLERRSEVCTILLQAGGEGGEAVSKCTLDIFYDRSYTLRPVLGVPSAPWEASWRYCIDCPPPHTIPPGP